jgi:hypothetical protein
LSTAADIIGDHVEEYGSEEAKEFVRTMAIEAIEFAGRLAAPRGRNLPRGALSMSEPTTEELLARIADLEKASGARAAALSLKVSEKGGVSIYGLGRFPVTLYYEQWTRLLDSADSIRAFIEENKGKLKLRNTAQH